MKRAIVLAFFALFVIVAVASADTGYITLNPGYNLVAAPMVPYDPSPSVVFKDSDNATIPINGGRLQKFDTASGGYLNYTPSSQTWGKILLGAGYFVRIDTTQQVLAMYPAVPNGVPDAGNMKTDMWISLPTAGFNMIGNPFNQNVSWPLCQMTNGTDTVDVLTAKTTKLWWSGSLQYFNNSSGGFMNISTSATSSSRWLKPGTGYFLQTNVPNLALIIPAN